MSTPYTTLVLQGGGVKGSAYVGALKALEEKGVAGQLQRFAGTSAGSIIAALLAAGYTHDDLSKVMTELDYNELEDGKEPLRLLTHYGLYKGDFFLEWMRDRLSTKLQVQPTFADLPKDCHVFATNLNTRSLTEFSREKTPDVSVAEAVRCSMSIPLFFAAYSLGGSLYVDGGVILNYPFLDFEQRDPGTVLGLHLDDLSHKMPARHDLGYDNPVEYVKALFETLVGAQQNAEFEIDSVARKQSVRIDDDGIRATDFGISSAQKALLVENGYKATIAFLNGGRRVGG
jgi:NTE family protein